jgi:hypothetical protein
MILAGGSFRVGSGGLAGSTIRLPRTIHAPKRA